MDVEVLAWADLVRLSGSVLGARALLRQGLWRRVLRDAYVPGDTADGVGTRLACLRAVLPADVAVSHRAALWAVGVDVLGDQPIDVTCPRGRHLLRRPGLRTHAADLGADELCQVGGLLVTSAARAVVDVARAGDAVEAVVVGDAALRAGATSLHLVAESLERAAGLRGVGVARVCFGLYEPRSESPMESRVRVDLVVAGARRPDAQLDVYDRDGHVGRADLHLDGVLIEYDGREARLDKQVFQAERRRQGRLLATGFELVRWTAADYYGRGRASRRAEVEAAVERAAGRRRVYLTGRDTLREPWLRPLPTLADLAVSRSSA